MRALQAVKKAYFILGLVAIVLDTFTNESGQNHLEFILNFDEYV